MEINYITTKDRLIEKGDIIPMYITSVIDSGLFVRYGTLKSFIPIHLLRHGFITNIYNEFEAGKQIFVKVIKISHVDGESEITVSGKDAQIDPWSEMGIVNELTMGKVVAGEVTAIKEYGIFVKLYDGVDALVRPLSKKADNYQEVHIGDTINVKIIDIDKKKRQIKGRLKLIEKRVRIHF